jgi:hypothetical protein
MSMFFENCENRVQRQTFCVIFKNVCHECPQNKIPHIVHLTNQHWMDQSSLCRYGFIP